MPEVVLADRRRRHEDGAGPGGRRGHGPGRRTLRPTLRRPGPAPRGRSAAGRHRRLATRLPAGQRAAARRHLLGRPARRHRPGPSRRSTSAPGGTSRSSSTCARPSPAATGRRPVVGLADDGHCFALGEHWLGAGRDVASMVGDGPVDRGRRRRRARRPAVRRVTTGNAVHLGHISVNAWGARCVCGGHGCVEMYARGPAMVARRAGPRLDRRHRRAGAHRRRPGGRPGGARRDRRGHAGAGRRDRDHGHRARRDDVRARAAACRGPAT